LQRFLFYGFERKPNLLETKTRASLKRSFSKSSPAKQSSRFMKEGVHWMAFGPPEKHFEESYSLTLFFHCHKKFPETKATRRHNAYRRFIFKTNSVAAFAS
jgi:hypothetical protein